MHISTEHVKVGDFISTAATRGEYVQVIRVADRYITSVGKNAEYVTPRGVGFNVEVLF